MAVTANDNDDDSKPLTTPEFEAAMTPEQKLFVHRECTRLLKECEGFEDAKGYIGDVIFDYQMKWEDSEEHQDQLREVIIAKLRLLDV